MPPGRPRKRPLESESTDSLDADTRGKLNQDKEEEIQVFDIVPPMKKTRHHRMFETFLQDELSSSGSGGNKESSPVLRRSTRRRTLVQEIKDMDPGSSSVFDTPPSTSGKPRRKPGRPSKAKVAEAAKTKESISTEESPIQRPCRLPLKFTRKFMPVPRPPPTLINLPDLVQSKLLRYLDVDALENLSQTCTHFDQFINGKFLTSIGIPFDSHFLKELSETSSVDKKPLLKITCNKPRELYKRVGFRPADIPPGAPQDIFPLNQNDSIYHVISELGSSPATVEYLLQSQLAMLSLDKLRELDLVPEEARDTRTGFAANNARILDGFLAYDRALVRHLCFSRALDNVTKLEVMVDQRMFVADHLRDFQSLQELGLTIVAKTGLR